MSSFGFTTSLLSQIAGASSTSDQFVTDLNQLAGDLESGNLSGAQQDYLTLSEDAQNGATASTASSTSSGITAGVLSAVAASPSASSAFVNELNLLGTDLGNGDLGAAQEDLLSLDGTALNAVGSSGTTTGGTGSSSSGTGTTGTTTGTTATGTSAADTQELIEAAVQAIGLGDGSLVSSALSQLASLTTNATGASVLKQDSESYASGSGSSQASSLTSSLTGSQANSQTSELLQSLNSGSSSSTGSLLSVLA